MSLKNYHIYSISSSQFSLSPNVCTYVLHTLQMHVSLPNESLASRRFSQRHGAGQAGTGVIVPFYQTKYVPETKQRLMKPRDDYDAL